MDRKSVIEIATDRLKCCVGHPFNQITLAKPESAFEALNMLKITSKLSPIIGNLFEIDAVELLNGVPEFKEHGTWIRQDPGFPDVLFETGESIEPGFEIKAWYPFATEITGRFKDSQNRFLEDQTYVLMFAWLPQHLMYGKPQLLDLCICSGRSVAAARDEHYHNPPDYLVIEPLDTSARTRNLQQTNTSGYKFQGTPAEFEKAEKLVASWGENGKKYAPTTDYQERLRDLMGQFKYRLDTNYAKMDRVFHQGIEDFKSRVLCRKVCGKAVAEWDRFLSNSTDKQIADFLTAEFKIEN